MGWITISEDVDVDDVVEEINDKTLLEEVKERGLMPELKEPKTELDYFKICDFFCVNHHTRIVDLIPLIKEELENQTNNIIINIMKEKIELDVLHYFGDIYVTDKDYKMLEIVYKSDWILACKCLKSLTGSNLKECREFLDASFKTDNSKITLSNKAKSHLEDLNTKIK